MFESDNRNNKIMNKLTNRIITVLALLFLGNSVLSAHELEISLADPDNIKTSEAGDSNTLLVRLTAEPFEDTSVSVVSSDSSEGIASPSSLFFTANNWDIFQAVVVTGVDDESVDGDVSYSIVFSADDLASVSVELVNLDDDSVEDIIDAVDDSVITQINTPVTIPVLANDTGCEDELFIDSVSSPSHGSAAISGSAIVYTPDTDFTGTDSFDYTISDCISSDTATVTVTVEQPDNNNENATTLLTQGEVQRSAGFGESVSLSVKVQDDDAQPVAGVVIDWSLQRLSSAAVGDGSLSVTQSSSDGNGLATTTLATGNLPETYQITASTTLSGNAMSVSFQVAVGSISTISDNRTPEAAAALAVDNTCPELAIAEPGSLTSGQLALQQRCNNIEAATAAGNDSEVADSLRQISPAEASIQGRTGELITSQQIGNVGARLAALRRGAVGVSLSGLAFNVNGEVLPGSLLQQAFNGGAGSGAASDDAGISPFGERLGVFATGTAAFGDQDSSAQEEGFDFDTLGITAGIDYRFTDQLVLGLALGYANTDADVDNDGGDFNADGLTVSAYGNFYLSDNVYLDTVLSYGRNDYELNRNIRYTVTTATGQDSVDARVNGDTDSDQLGLSVGAGYQFNFANGLALTFDGRLNYIDADIDGYQETGSNTAGLELLFEQQSWESLTLTIGGEISKPISMNWGVLIPRARLEWEHEFKDDPEDITFRFVNAVSDPTVSFEVREPDTDYFRLGGGVNALFTQGRSAFIYGETTLGRDDYTDYSLNLGLRLEF